MNEKLAWKWFGMAVVLVCSSSVWAAFTDGFESGLGGWTAMGPVQAVTDEYPRNSGLSSNWLPTEGNYFASLWSTDSGMFANSELSRSFAGVAGETLRFDYYFDFNDGDAGGPEAPIPADSDKAMAILSSSDGDITLFDRTSTTAGWQNIAYELTKSQMYTLTFAAKDMDGTWESVMGVDNVSVGTAVVPAPGALVLGVIGTGLVSWLRRKRIL